LATEKRNKRIPSFGPGWLIEFPSWVLKIPTSLSKFSRKQRVPNGLWPLAYWATTVPGIDFPMDGFVFIGEIPNWPSRGQSTMLSIPKLTEREANRREDEIPNQAV
jgi:hypothetical protein